MDSRHVHLRVKNTLDTRGLLRMNSVVFLRRSRRPCLWRTGRNIHSPTEVTLHSCTTRQSDRIPYRRKVEGDGEGTVDSYYGTKSVIFRQRNSRLYKSGIFFTTFMCKRTLLLFVDRFFGSKSPPSSFLWRCLKQIKYKQGISVGIVYTLNPHQLSFILRLKCVRCVKYEKYLVFQRDLKKDGSDFNLTSVLYFVQ